MAQQQPIRRNKRNQKYRRRRRIVYTCVALVILLLAVLLYFLIRFVIVRFDPLGDASSAAATTAPTTTTTTTIRTLPAADLDARLGSYGIQLYDLTQDAVVYSRNAEEMCYPASLTKLLTAIVGINKCSEDTVFTVGSQIKTIIDPQSSTAGLKAGMKLDLPTLLDAMLLPSGNDAAYVLALHVGRLEAGGAAISDADAIANFSRLMNETASGLGCKNSHFANPDGIYNDQHYTTPADMMRIARHAATYPLIRNTVSKKTARDILVSGQDVTWHNSNVMLYETYKNAANPYYMPEVTGMKTGSTNESGKCLVVSAIRDGRELLAVIMNSATDAIRWEDAVTLLNAGFDNVAAIQ